MADDWEAKVREKVRYAEIVFLLSGQNMHNAFFLIESLFSSIS